MVRWLVRLVEELVLPILELEIVELSLLVVGCLLGWLDE